MKKIAIVTGCNGGIGGAVAKKLLENGYVVFGMARRPEIDIESPDFRYIRGDVSLKEDRENLVNCAMKEGRIDVLVNVAGVAPAVRSDVLEVGEESYDRVMNINLKGAFFLTQLVANKMIEDADCSGKRIINISSLSSYTSSVNRAEYCISKSGVTMVTKIFADRLSEYGITVNEIRPGIIRTDMTEGVKDKYDRLIDGGLLPIKRWGEADDVASAVLSLISPDMGYITGVSLDVDGGFHIRRL
jgi:NAD(P)-dependent dehydrogenase (short-subunit alcohol dehydrogenase family)